MSSEHTHELVEKIHQFLSHQIESNRDLSEAAKESLTVANECIEQAYMIQRKPASNELLNIYSSSRTQQNDSSNNNNNNNNNPFGAMLGNNPAAFIQNLANNILSQATVGAATATGSTSTTNDSASANQTGFTSSSSTTTQARPPKVRKRPTESEKLAADSFKNQGNDYMKQDKYKEAYDCYTQAINLDDNTAIYYSNRAAASSKLGDHQAALNDCQEAVEIDPTYSKAYGRMGLAYASMDDHKKAKEAYTKAVELDPTNESYRNNLKIAEEKLAETNMNAAAGGQNNMMNMLRSMMNNPEVMQMAMRSLQDPRLQSLFNNISGGAQPNQPGDH